MNRVEFAGLLTDLAADTAALALRHNLLALLVVIAVNEPLLSIGHKLDDVLRADRDTLLAGLAFFRINIGDSVNDMDRVKRAGVNTGTVTQASEVAGLRAAVLHIFHHGAVLKSVVRVLLVGHLLVADTFDKGDHPAAFLSLDSHDGTDSLSDRVAADRAGIDRCLALGDRCRKTRTSREAASAAVITGQSFEHSRFLLIYFNCKLSSGKPQE